MPNDNHEHENEEPVWSAEINLDFLDDDKLTDEQKVQRINRIKDEILNNGQR